MAASGSQVRLEEAACDAWLMRSKQDGMVRLWDVKRRRWRNTIPAGSFFISEGAWSLLLHLREVERLMVHVSPVKLFQDDTRLLSGGGDRIIAVRH